MMMKCDICNLEHDVIDDIYEWYGHYLEYNHKCYDKEIWDKENSKWIKVSCCENNEYSFQSTNTSFKVSNSSDTDS